MFQTVSICGLHASLYPSGLDGYQLAYLHEMYAWRLAFHRRGRPQPCQGHLAAAGVVEDAPHGALNPSYEAMKAAL